MKEFKKVKCTAIEVLPFERIGDKISIKTNIVKINEPPNDDGFSFEGWEYDEIIYSIEEYMEELQDKNDILLLEILKMKL